MVKRKASINAIQYVRNLPKERTIAKRFSQDISPSSVGFECKGTIKFADVQENGDFFSRFAGYRTFMRAMGYWVKGGHLAIDPIVKVAESLTNH